MRRLITILAVVSLACLIGGGAYATDTPPAGYDIINFVNLGDLTSEADPFNHNLAEWSAAINPHWANMPDGIYRQIWGPSVPESAQVDYFNWATIDLDFTKGAKSGHRYLGFYFLAGAADDNFYVYIDGTLIGEVTELQGSNQMVRKDLAVPEWVTAGIHNVKLVCSEDAWGTPPTSQAEYGQVTIDEIYTFVGDEMIEPVLVGTPTTIGCVDGTQLVNFEFTKGLTDILGYTVRVSLAAGTLDFGFSDITVIPHATGLVINEDYYYAITPSIGGAETNDWTIDYVILGDPDPADGIPTGNLFSINFHGAGDGTHLVSMDSARLSALDGTPVGVEFATTVEITVDCTAPDAPFMTGLDPYTLGLTNTVEWTDTGGTVYKAECSTVPNFASVHETMDWTLTLTHTFTGLIHGQIYYYRVMAMDDLLNESGWSNVESSTQDNLPPETEAAVTDPDTDGWVESFFDVTYSGSDANSGIASVELFYRIDFVDPYVSGGIFTGTTINFEALVEGTYEFYSIATDIVGNVEAFSGVDATINVDLTAPATHVDAFGPPGIITDVSFNVSYTLESVDESGLASVDLYYYRYITGEVPPFSFTKYPTAFSGTSLTFNSSTTGGDGTYYFYSIGTDNAGNVELQPDIVGPPSMDYDVSILVDTAGPDVTSFWINGETETLTNSRSVTLFMDVDGALDMRFTNVYGVWTLPENGWEVYAGTFDWELTDNDGPNTVYAEFRENVSFNITTAQDDIELDTAATGPVSGITADRGHNKITVNWTNPGDGEEVLEVWRQVWHNGTQGQSAYPEYDDDNPIAPLRLSSHPGDPGDWIMVYNGPVISSFLDNPLEDPIVPLDRGIYYYEVFVQDLAGNWSDPASDYAFNLSYLLGDVKLYDDGLGNFLGDGRVMGDDITVLGATYGIDDNHGSYNPNCDVGPTDDFSGAGIPTTDNRVNFDDLMIFALNWDEEVTKIQPTGGSMIARFSWVKADDTTWSLVLVEPCASLKGVNLQADLPQDATLSVTAGSLLGQQDNPYFLKNIPTNGLDAGMALLGNGACITGQGELIRISLTGEFDPEDILIVARDTANKDLEYSVEETTAAANMPTRYALSANYPNPFNPSTKIEFALPEAQHVRLAVFAIDGRRIATLRNESMSAGHHSVTWTGRDDRGGLVAAGIYFYRIQAGDFSQTQKMTLVK